MESDRILSKEAVQTTIVSIYGAICTMGILCNALFIACVGLSREKKRSVTRMLLANLALSDICMLLFAIFSPLSALQTDWQFGLLWCKLAQSGSAMSIFVSSFSATVIALHRYLSIVEPHIRKQLQASAAWFVIAATWLAALCFSSAIFAKANVHRIAVIEAGNASNLSHRKCVELWDQEKTAGQIFTVSCLTIQFVLPSLVIGLCYSRVSQVLRSRLRFQLSRASHQTQRRIVANIRRQRRTTRTLALMLALYVLCWMPFNVFMLILTFNVQVMAAWPPMELLYVLMHGLAVSSAVHNPVVYSWAHAEFRRQAFEDFRRCSSFFSTLRCCANCCVALPNCCSLRSVELVGNLSQFAFRDSESNNLALRDSSIR